MKERYEALRAQLAEYFAAGRRSGYHNYFHIDMPFGLINDPNGLCEHEGYVYIFYQWNPFGCDHKTKHWGMVRTADFVNYSLPKIVLCPTDAFDKDGCYSGCGVSRADGIELIYTGNVKDENGARSSLQVMAKYKDGAAKKEKIIIDGQPDGYTAHFRDPFYLQKDGGEYIFIGAQSDELKGCIALYEKVGENWLYKGRLQTSFEDFGYMWECPNVLDFGEKQAVLFCPQGLCADGIKYNNAHQSGCAVGKLDMEKCAFSHGEFMELDNGFDFYAPQVFARGGEKILIGWGGMPDRDGDYPTDGEGWRFALTLPRVVTEKGGRLYQKPLAELLALRKEKRAVSVAEYGEIVLEKRCAELELEFDGYAAKVELCMGGEKITLAKADGLITLDRSLMTLGGRGRRSARLNEARLKLDIFIDRSMLEIYINDGASVMTAAYFPKAEEMTVKIYGRAKGFLYELSQINYRD